MSSTYPLLFYHQLKQIRCQHSIMHPSLIPPWKKTKLRPISGDWIFYEASRGVVTPRDEGRIDPKPTI